MKQCRQYSKPSTACESTALIFSTSIDQIICNLKEYQPSQISTTRVKRNQGFVQWFLAALFGSTSAEEIAEDERTHARQTAGLVKHAIKNFRQVQLIQRKNQIQTEMTNIQQALEDRTYIFKIIDENNLEIAVERQQTLCNNLANKIEKNYKESTLSQWTLKEINEAIEKKKNNFLKAKSYHPSNHMN